MSKSGRLNEFFALHAVFTVEELDCFLSERSSGNVNTRKSLLTYHRNQGRIMMLRRGLYAVVPYGYSPDNCTVDPYMIAAKLTKDAVLAYHTALEFHGKAHTVFSRFHYMSVSKSLPFRFRSFEFRSVSMPAALIVKDRMMFGVDRYMRSGVEIRVTDLERTMVDVLNRPELTGSWEEIWRSLQSIEYFDLDKVLKYTLLLENATTAAKVGFFLEQNREALMVSDSYLYRLHELRPMQPHYMIRGKREGCKLVKDWNLLVPEEILNESWGEIL